MQLVTEIIFNSLYLVQDPFGNYVIQYILDLNDARFSEPLIRTFIGNVCSLSVQKFSSNVVEKCIRVADPEIRKVLVTEVLNRPRLEKLLRDSYGNYVIQTILDYCDIAQRMLVSLSHLLSEIRADIYHSLSIVSDLSYRLSETLLMANVFNPNLLAKTPHSVLDITGIPAVVVVEVHTAEHPSTPVI